MHTTLNHLIKHIYSRFRTRGFLSLFASAFFKIKRWLFPGHYILYCCELSDLSEFHLAIRPDTIISSYSNVDSLPPGFRKQMFERQGGGFETQAKRRFVNGAKMWLIEQHSKIVGFLWTVNRETTKPYFWPMMDKDILIIDVLVFESHRGKGFSSYATEWILHQMKRSGAIRALIQTHDWNIAEMKALSRTSFKRVGKCTRTYGKKINKVIWYEMLGNFPQEQ